jgi:2,3-bisphosphoglycerate-independent phosphoglycerate mutase
LIDFPGLPDLILKSDSKIVMLVIDGLGGLPPEGSMRSELGSANIPNLHSLARESAGGLSIPVLPGIAPGSGPGHLALFGYDPLNYVIGRGVLEALGIDLPLEQGDVAARGNFATVDSDGLLTDRRAGRIDSSAAIPLAAKLDQIKIDGVDLHVQHVKDYRFVLRLRAPGLAADLTETDPQRLNVSPLPVTPKNKSALGTADVANRFVEESITSLKHESPANMILLRGWSVLPSFPAFPAAYGLRAAAIAAYPMYRGLAKTVGMDVLQAGNDFLSELQTLRTYWDEYDFFYLHYKPADTAGEDGNFDAKIQALEQIDQHIPEVRGLNPSVFIVAGDHSTPATMSGHSWHPVPFLLNSKWTVGEGVDRFEERYLRHGSLGQFEAKHIMLLALAHAGRLGRYGP